VSEAPTEVSTDGFTSQIVHRYERLSKKTQELFRKLCVEGLATGDFEPVFRELIGETAALSATTIVRLKATWGEDYEAGRTRSLKGHTSAYIWSDGMYLGAVGEEDTRAPCCAYQAPERTVWRNYWRWNWDIERAPRAAPMSSKDCEIEVFVHRWWPWETEPRDCGQPWTRSSP